MAMDKVDKDDFLFFVKDVIKNNPNWLSDLQLAIMSGISNRLQEEINYRANAEKSLSVCYDAINGEKELFERCKDDVIKAIKNSKLFSGTEYAKKLDNDSTHKDIQEINKVIALDNSKIGRFGFNKCITFNNDKQEICITVYDTTNRQDGFDEQLSFTPEELLEFCREVIRISEQ
jgi:hypothetical protein